MNPRDPGRGLVWCPRCQAWVPKEHDQRAAAHEREVAAEYVKAVPEPKSIRRGPESGDIGVDAPRATGGD